MRIPQLPSRRNPRARAGRVLLVALVGLWLNGCVGTGSLEVSETYYLAVPGEDNTNYFRIRVMATTDMGDAKYRSGWFPAEAVDQVYGNSQDSSNGPAATLTRRQIRNMYDDAIKNSTEAYLIAAQNPNTTEAEIQRLLEAKRRVRATESDGLPLPNGTVEVEYNPASSLVLRHAGEKLILVLSSNPDQVLGAIERAAAGNDTSASILRLADIIQQQAASDVVQTEAANAANSRRDALVIQRIDGLLALLADPSLDATRLQQEIDAMVYLVENLQ